MIAMHCFQIYADLLLPGALPSCSGTLECPRNLFVVHFPVVCLFFGLSRLSCSASAFSLSAISLTFWLLLSPLLSLAVIS